MSFVRVVTSALCAWLLAVSAATAWQGAAPPAADGQAPRRAVLIHFDAPITPLFQQSVLRRLETARKLQPDLLILQIDSPGGYLETSLELARTLSEIKDARTVAYIPRDAQALSGAAIVALGCDDLVMYPTALIGDAGVITGAENVFRYVEEKFLTNVIQQVRILAEAKGRSPALAEAMVNRKAVVWRVRHRQTGEEKFLTVAGLQGSDQPWEKLWLVEESSEEKFLEVNGRRAVELQLARRTVENLPQLKEIYGLTEDPLVLRTTWVDTVVTVLNNPWVTGMLFVIGLLCLYLELQVPGIGVFGLSAALCFLLFFWSRVLGGTADWLEVLLFLFGVLSLVVELFVIPGFGVPGFAGILLIVASILLAGQRNVVPQTPEDYQSLLRTFVLLGTSMLVFGGVAVVLSRYFGALPLFRVLVLEPPGGEGPAAEPATAAAADSPPLAEVGQRGAAYSSLRPTGKAEIDGRLLDVTTDGQFIESGAAVEVVEVRGRRIVVRRVEGPS